MKEQWRDIKGFEGRYQISNTGQVLSLQRRGRLRKHFLKQKQNRGGYWTCALYKTKAHYMLVHRLVAEAFIPNPLNKYAVNHKDGNKRNNNASNLEWCTFKENEEHALKLGLKGPEFKGYALGEDVGTSKITARIASEIRRRKLRNPLTTQHELALRFKISSSQVGRILRQQRWRHLKDNYGSNPVNAGYKMTKEKVCELRKLHSEDPTISRKLLMRKFNIGREQVRRILSYERWANI